MVGDTFHLLWTDALVTVMLGAILMVQLLSGDKYAERLSEGRKLAEEWKTKRAALAASARRVARRVGFGLYITSLLMMAAATLWNAELRALLNTTKYPIMFTEVCLVALLIGHMGLYIGIINTEPR